MDFSEMLVRALVGQFKDQDLRLGTPPEPTVVFRAKRADVGDVAVSIPRLAASSVNEIVSATVTIGEILVDDFTSLDTHLTAAQQAERVTGEVIRFLEHLFSDRLLFWKSADERGSRGWRECSDGKQAEPLVMDDRTYDVYLWSGPKPQWRATTAILSRGAIRDERDYQILQVRLDDPGAMGLHGEERMCAMRLIADYERDRDE